ncbi:MAG: hypothetical protein Q8O12_00085 [Candidatus Omnitrophota bacterium]|nr:hypothetical protein [Candidatus Omnitrophota bacterium]
MRNLIAIVLTFIFAFEWPGYSLADALRKPLICAYEAERLSGSDTSDIDEILPQLAQGSINQKIAYCIMTRNRRDKPIEHLLTWLKGLETDINLRKASLVRLLSLAETDNYVGEKLLERLNIEHDKNIRLAIVKGLLPLADTNNNIRRKLLEHYDKENKFEILFAIRDGLLPLADKHEDVRGKLSRFLNVEHGIDIHFALVDELLPLVDKHEDARKELLGRLDTEYDDNRLAIIRGLSPLAGAYNDVRKKLLERLDTESSINNRLAIIRGLSPLADRYENVKEKLESAVKELLECLDKESNGVIRLAIVRGLSPLADMYEGIKEKLLEQFDKEDDNHFRLTIIQCLPMDNDVKKKLLEWLDMKYDPRLREASIRRLLSLDDTRKELLEHLDTEYDGYNRLTIIWGLSPLADVYEDIKKKLLERLDKERDNSVCSVIIRCLSPLADNDESTKNKLNNARKQLLECLDTEYGDDIRLAIIQDLLPLADIYEDIKKKLLERLDKERDGNVHLAIVKGLLILEDADGAIRNKLKSILINDTASSVQEMQILAYAFSMAEDETYAPYAYTWEDQGIFSISSEHYHDSLSNIHSFSHALFLDWVNTLPSASFPFFKDRRMEKDSASLDSKPYIIDAKNGRWLGRSLVIKDKSGPGGVIYKIKRSKEALDDFLTEAGMWNKLNPDSKGTVMGNCKIINLPGQDIEIFTNLTVFKYHVEDIKSFTTYAIDWDPENADELAGWLCNSIDELAKIAENGWGYTGLVEYYHDIASNRKYDLGITPVGCLDNIDESMRFSNIRLGGRIADISPQHMTRFKPSGATPFELAKAIRDQCFQLALIAGRVSAKKRFSYTELNSIIERIGDRFTERYAFHKLQWKRNLPVTITGISKEILFAMDNLQDGTDMGFDNNSFSAPSIVAFSETIAKTIVEALLAKDQGLAGVALDSRHDL